MFISINLQQWALDLSVNPVFDGIDNSGSARLLLNYNIGMYNDINLIPTAYTQLSNYT